ncbi:MAG: CPBP family intramembrane glutamic endopeptidase [Propionibacteriaceae bacterium]
MLIGLPVIALLLGLIFGGSLHTADLGSALIRQLGSILLPVVVINLWEETVWAGFFQTRLEARFNFVVAAALTALPFAGVHVPLLLLDDQVSALSVLKGIGGLLILGIVVRLLMGVTMRAALDSVLAVGILHQIFDASNNNGGLVDSLLDGADAGNMTQLAAVILTILIAACCSGDVLAHSPNAIHSFQIPLARLGNHDRARGEEVKINLTRPAVIARKAPAGWLRWGGSSSRARRGPAREMKRLPAQPDGSPRASRFHLVTGCC